MKFKSISIIDGRTGWNAKAIHFNSMLTLLVGASGVGKTKILNGIYALKQIASGLSYYGMEWKTEFEQNGRIYVWEGAFEAAKDIKQAYFEEKNEGYVVTREIITENGEELVNRNSQSIFYKGQELVKLDNTKSVVELLQKEPSVEPIYKGFQQCYDMDTSSSVRISPIVDVSRRNALSFMLIRSLRMFSPLERLFLLYENKLNEFDIICQKFQRIFPTVEKLDFTLVKVGDDKLLPLLRMKEKNVSIWIEQTGISSGMMRTLLQIITLVLANDGDVIMIDEFENGLGVNCINELADLIMEPEADLQVIMTSHHPYIINAIPVKDWIILTRNGSDVYVHTADELHIGEHSKHEAFMQLLQSPEYKTGLNRNR